MSMISIALLMTLKMIVDVTVESSCTKSFDRQFNKKNQRLQKYYNKRKRFLRTLIIDPFEYTAKVNSIVRDNLNSLRYVFGDVMQDRDSNPAT